MLLPSEDSQSLHKGWDFVGFSPTAALGLLCMFEVHLVRLDPELPVPRYAKEGDAGVDLYARHGTVLKAGGGRALVPTGVAVAIPVGFAGFVQPRSGLAAQHGITALNSPGLIDSGYRGEISVLLVNTDPSDSHTVNRGDRIAQLVLQRVEQAVFVEVADGDLPKSERGTGGFGHSGK